MIGIDVVALVASIISPFSGVAAYLESRTRRKAKKRPQERGQLTQILRTLQTLVLEDAVEFTLIRNIINRSRADSISALAQQYQRLSVAAPITNNTLHPKKRKVDPSSDLRAAKLRTSDEQLRYHRAQSCAERKEELDQIGPLPMYKLPKAEEVCQSMPNEGKGSQISFCTGALELQRHINRHLLDKECQMCKGSGDRGRDGAQPVSIRANSSQSISREARTTTTTMLSGVYLTLILSILFSLSLVQGTGTRSLGLSPSTLTTSYPASTQSPDPVLSSLSERISSVSASIASVRSESALAPAYAQYVAILGGAAMMGVGMLV
ncbi:hypothetical protein EK21DRAFT_85499 [Setomelanomma holmii]|uniref:Uncharacterized protein n=1 Tax=Setomelanomma holmii TaxID=210430 RepID=A0A9P4HJ22_9PLEO|nr:hypothetical protein EK21DRAFT_85499 [Setomelanomma holmii]